jgi:opacity protein-like surface antigen
MKRTVVVLAAVLVLGLAGLAQAGSYVGVYGGYAYLPDASVDVTSEDFGSWTTDFKMEGGPTAGGKFGYWMKSLPWLAFEFNVWHTWAEFEDVNDINVDLGLLNLSGSVLLQYWSCPFRAYAGGGILGTRADMDPDLESIENDASDWAVGAVAQAGLEYTFKPGWGLFGEYRYSWNSFNLEAEEIGVEYDFSLSRHDFLLGVNYHF